MFFKKKELTPMRTEEYEEVLKRFAILRADFDILKHQVDNLMILNTEIRVLKARMTKHMDEHKAEDDEEQEDINTANNFTPKW